MVVTKLNVISIFADAYDQVKPHGNNSKLTLFRCEFTI